MPGGGVEVSRVGSVPAVMGFIWGVFTPLGFSPAQLPDGRCHFPPVLPIL